MTNRIFKNTIKARIYTRTRLTRLMVGSCDCCNSRFPVWWWSNREGKYFEGNGCASSVSLYDKIDRIVISTGYGSGYDGFVFLIDDSSKYTSVDNICDLCISKGIVNKDIEYLYDYTCKGLDYNSKYHDLMFKGFGSMIIPMKDDDVLSLYRYAYSISKLPPLDL